MNRRCWFNSFAAWLLLTLGLAGAAHAAGSINGAWTLVGNGYLAMVQDSVSGSVVVVQVNPTFNSGTVYVGTRSGDAVAVQSLDRSSTLNLAINAGSFSGTQTVNASTSAVSGQLLFAYQGSATDGVWQKNGSNERYLMTLSLIASNVPLMLLIDVGIDAATAGVSYDISTGTVAGATPTYVGKSLTSTKTISLVFKGGNPATAAYSAVDGGRPPRLLEPFEATQIMKVAQ